MKLKFLLIVLFSINHSYAQSSLQKEYPYGLLTPDYNILSKKDLLEDIKEGNPRPYNFQEMQGGYYRWQCFPIKNIKPVHRTWRDNDPMGPSNIIVTLCDFEIIGTLGTVTHAYGLRRAKLLEFCQEFQKAWDQATKNESHICIQGEPQEPERKKVNGKTIEVKPWLWNKFKTKKGSHSFF